MKCTDKSYIRKATVENKDGEPRRIIYLLDILIHYQNYYIIAYPINFNDVSIVHA
jgi:hypothetical protein